MNLHLYRATWGYDPPWDDLLARLPELGYTGIESPLIHLQREPEGFAERHGLRCLPQIFTEGDTVDEHVASFRAQLEACLPFDPPFVNCHDGRDAFTPDEAERYFREVLAIEADLGLTVSHETHRGRVLYNPWTTARLLDRFDDLRLCCDFSHWVCVCERLIDDLEPILAQCAHHALHIHARVGYAEGPQVPDPRAPEYAAHVETHERWWDLVWASQHERGLDTTTLTPEFGPPAYLHTLPYTNVPVADLWDINTWQGRRQAERFAARFG